MATAFAQLNRAAGDLASVPYNVVGNVEIQLHRTLRRSASLGENKFIGMDGTFCNKGCSGPIQIAFRGDQSSNPRRGIEEMRSRQIPITEFVVQLRGRECGIGFRDRTDLSIQRDHSASTHVRGKLEGKLSSGRKIGYVHADLIEYAGQTRALTFFDQSQLAVGDFQVVNHQISLAEDAAFEARLRFGKWRRGCSEAYRNIPSPFTDWIRVVSG